MTFPTEYEEILKRIDDVDPIKYARTRNYTDGAVSYLSPYISRGVISTKQVFKRILERGYSFPEAEKFIQELAWRDYWQQVWRVKRGEIDQDLKHLQTDVNHHEVPTKILDANTGIIAVDEAILMFYETGYMHNHVRMYVASVACNVARSHWHNPAQWFYAHLLDGDWASNALSWQWVAGSNSNKKYFANQKNINTFCYTQQRNSIVSKSYEELQELDRLPNDWMETAHWQIKTELPKSDALSIDTTKQTLIYNYYNLDPKWRAEENANRVLLLEPSVFERYPVASKPLDFALALAKNIPGIQVFVGEFEELLEQVPDKLVFKEHPLNTHYQGKEEPRDWLTDVEGYFPSFFAFWKRSKKQLDRWEPA